MTDVLFEAPGASPRPPGEEGRPRAVQGEGGAGRPLLEIHVVGMPAPQGSKKAFVVGTRAVVVDDNKPRLRTWREDVKQAALAQIELHRLGGTWEALTDCDVDITFLLPRPKSHYRTGRYSHELRPNAPARPTTKPDGDKLVRATLDALKTAGVYRDDANVVEHTGRKRYTTGHPGALIAIYTGTA